MRSAQCASERILYRMLVLFYETVPPLYADSKTRQENMTGFSLPRRENPTHPPYLHKGAVILDLFEKWCNKSKPNKFKKIVEARNPWAEEQEICE